MKPLTPKEKSDKKARDNLKIIHNQILSAFSFGRVKTWNEVYEMLGILPTNPNPITYPELKNFLQQQKDELESRLKGVEELKVEPSQPKESQDLPFQPVSRPSEYLDEFNDCTVLALSASLGINYKDAHELLAAESRKTGRGLRTDYLSEFLLDIGFELRTDLVNIKLIDLLGRLEKPSKYFIRSRDHAFALVNGVVHDTTKPSPEVNVERVYKFVGKKHEVTKVAEEVYDTKSNYGYVQSPNVNKSLYLFWHQKKAIAELKRKLVDENKSGVLLLAPTGVGKTFDTYGVLRWMLDLNFHEDKTWSHIPYLILTKATIVEQHRRVAENFFNIGINDCEITNIEALRSKAGQYWVREKVIIEGGQEKVEWEWKPNINPCVTLLDESQGVKNKKAKQTQIVTAYTKLNPDRAKLVCISATPFTRVMEAKVFAISTHRPLDHMGFPKGTLLTEDTWPAYAGIIASPSKPDEYNQAAVARLMDDLEPWVVRVRGVRPQFNALNNVKIINFESAEQREFYDSAWERFLQEKAKLEAIHDAGDSTGTCYLVILLKFAMAAEFCHARHFARSMYEDVTKRGKAAVAAVKFKQTLIEIVRILNEEYGVSRDNISLIWGGGQTQLTKKQKAKAKIKEMAEKLKEMGIDSEDMLKDTGLDEVEDRVIKDYPAHLRLGPQSQDERQSEIDKFQAGRTLYGIYTLKAGGVGLSLHHSDEFTEFKCRRKESGYVVEEDIPKVPVRPRTNKVTVTYNAIELVQGVGRVPRLTSLSPTEQDICCFAGTVEVDMGKIYSQKLRCLSAVVKQREDWQDVIFGANRARVVEQHLEKTKNEVSDESTLIDEGDSDEEDENGNGDEK